MLSEQDSSVSGSQARKCGKQSPRPNAKPGAPFVFWKLVCTAVGIPLIAVSSARFVSILHRIEKQYFNPIQIAEKTLA
jgi:hypothetical protein